MIFSLLKPIKSADHDTPLKKIHKMLDQTWDLSKQFELPAGDVHSCAVDLFNGFLKRLNDIITRILQSIVQLSSLAPGLFEFVKECKRSCLDQERKVRNIAQAGVTMASRIQNMAERIQALAGDSEEIKKEVGRADTLGRKSMEQFKGISSFVGELVQTTTVLDDNAKSIASIIDALNTISDKTNFLSLNARIEAMRSVGDNKGFKVIAEEIAQLAKQSKEATADIQNRLKLLNHTVTDTVNSVNKVEETVRRGEQYSREAQNSLEHVNSRFEFFAENLSEIKISSLDQSEDIQSISSDILEVESAVQYQSETVGDIVSVAEKINGLCDTMIVDTGIFHLSEHRKARKVAEEMVADGGVLSMRREEQEKALSGFLKRYPFIELTYITDHSGRQITHNVYSDKVLNQENLEQGFQCDWSQKEWFLRPFKTKKTFISNTYRSSATGRFCFTVSVPFGNTESSMSGVLAIDINVEDMLSI